MSTNKKTPDIIADILDTLNEYALPPSSNGQLEGDDEEDRAKYTEYRKLVKKVREKFLDSLRKKKWPGKTDPNYYKDIVLMHLGVAEEDMYTADLEFTTQDAWEEAIGYAIIEILREQRRRRF